MARWRLDELHPALKNLIARVEAEREATSGEDRRYGMTKKELAFTAGIAPRTYYRYLEGESLPVNEKGVDGILRLAEAVGIDRSEAEAYLPQPLSTPEFTDGSGHALRELLAEVRHNGERMEHMESNIIPVLKEIRDLLQRLTL